VRIVKLVVDVPEEVRRKLKIATATRGETIRDVILRAIEDYLREPPKRRGKA
jgi:hypothetical protein